MGPDAETNVIKTVYIPSYGPDLKEFTLHMLRFADSDMLKTRLRVGT